MRQAACAAGRKKIDYFDAAQRGFMLEVRCSGGKTYYQRYTDERGRERQYKIGPADVLSLDQARRKARQIVAEALWAPTRSRSAAKCGRTATQPFRARTLSALCADLQEQLANR